MFSDDSTKRLTFKGQLVSFSCSLCFKVLPVAQTCPSSFTGITVVLRRKFSASQFWNDCRKYNVTVIQYIGEIMRYLCNTPKVMSKAAAALRLSPLVPSLLPSLQKDDDREHQVRLALGNGVRADTWAEFLQRFGDIRVCECYGATEGNVGFLNYTGKVGAVGKDHFLFKVREGDLLWLQWAPRTSWS